MDFLEYSINLSFPSSLLSLHLSPFQTYLKCIRTWLIYQISKYSSWLLSPFPFNFLLFFFFSWNLLLCLIFFPYFLSIWIVSFHFPFILFFFFPKAAYLKLLSSNECNESGLIKYKWSPFSMGTEYMMFKIPYCIRNELRVQAFSHLQ